MKTPGRNTEVANYIIEEESKFSSMDKVGRIYNNASIDNYMDAQMSTDVAKFQQDPMEELEKVYQEEGDLLPEPKIIKKLSRKKTPQDLSQFDQTECRETLTIEDFKFIKQIGKGSFGKVYLVRNLLTDSLHALKCINRELILE
jgi:serine/threonine protein kinase